MMYGNWHQHGMGAWGWFAMAAWTVLAPAALAVMGVMVLRRWAGGRRMPSEATAAGSGVGGAERILAERFARGEIDETEYRSRLDVLRSGPR